MYEEINCLKDCIKDRDREIEALITIAEEQKNKIAELEEGIKLLDDEAEVFGGVVNDLKKEELIYVSSRLLAGVYAGRQNDIDALNHETIGTNAVNAAKNLIEEVDRQCSETTKKEL